MPQVDLETLVSVCAGGANDRKIACETTLAEPDDDRTKNDVIVDDYAEAVDVEPDFPPESFWLSKDAEYDWFDRNAVYERKESTKGNSNSTNLSNSNSNSQRSSIKLMSKAAIIGLPKTQKTTFVRTCKPGTIRLFPKRAESVGKPTVVPAAEPGSPKVSCMGRVRSKRGRRRSNSSRRKEKSIEKEKTGFYSKVMSMFRSKRGHRKSSRLGSRKVVEEAVAEPRRSSVSSRVREFPATEPPSLGGVQRFASGRRSGSWAAEDFNQAISGSLDLDRHVDPMSRS